MQVGSSDPDGDELRFTWMVLPEVGKLNEAAREGLVWEARPQAAAGTAGPENLPSERICSTGVSAPGFFNSAACVSPLVPLQTPNPDPIRECAPVLEGDGSAVAFTAPSRRACGCASAASQHFPPRLFRHGEESRW